MWLEGEKLHFKSYNEAALRSSVRSQVFIPMEDLELMNEITGKIFLVENFCMKKNYINTDFFKGL